jgi:hypothetical protein
VAISEGVKEIRCVYHRQESLEISVEVLIAGRKDSIDSIFMAENSSSGVGTRHINTKYHFIHDHVEDGCIKIFFRTIDNDSDILTKDVNKEWYEKHVVIVP